MRGYDDIEVLGDVERARDQVLAAARRAFDGEFGTGPGAVDVWPCIGADPRLGRLAALGLAARPEHAELFAWLGHTLAGPAAKFCRDLAAITRATD